MYLASVATVEAFAELLEPGFRSPILVGTLLAHPFYVVSLNVMYARFYKTQAQQEAYKNCLAAAKTIYKTHGLRGFMRGVVPMIIMNSVYYKPT